ncbi:MAG: protein kinase domain-containing protein [Solirubrobacteraceae bacterium]
MHSWWALDPEWVDRFEQEAKLTASLKHPGIVTVHDTGQDEQIGLWIVLELVDGESLARRIARGPLEPERAAVICADVLDALHAAHARGIVHRDIGPQNVLLGQDGSVKITDFGVAYLSTGLTRSSAQATVVGKPIYMSPEQSRGKPVGAASDIYAVGVVLYELLTGHPPFDGENYVEIAMKHNSDKVPPLPDGVPSRLAAVVERALAKEPGDRFASAADLAAALRTTNADTRPTEKLTTRTANQRQDRAAPASGDPTIPLGPLADHKPRRRRRALASTGVLLAAGAGVALALALTQHPSHPSAPPPTNVHNAPSPALKRKARVVMVKAPKLVGLSRAAARRLATAHHLRFLAADATSGRVPAGQVIGQQPGVGARAPRGSDITATVSSGPPPATVPSVTNLSVNSAESALAAVALKASIAAVPGGGAAHGTVVGQAPEGGASVQPGSAVRLEVARTPVWHTVDTMTLSSDGSSPRFRITAHKWRIRYTLKIGPCPDTGGQCFGPSMDVTAADGTFHDYELGAGSHETYVPDPPGTYSFSLCCAQDPYTAEIVVEECS